MATKTFIYELGDGPDTEQSTEQLDADSSSVSVRVWASGDLDGSSETVTVSVDGTQVVSGNTGRQDNTPVAERKDAIEVTDNPVNISLDDINSVPIEVSVPGDVDALDTNISARVWVVFEYAPAVLRPDTYRDFTYARTLATLGESDSTIQVDTVERFPPNAILEKSRFMATIESDLRAGDFEVVRVLEKDESANTLTLQRGAEGTSAAAHPDFTIIKGALTSEMLYRARSVFIYDDMPAIDYDLFVDGDIVWDQQNEIAYVLVDYVWIALTANTQAALERIQAAFGHIARSLERVESTLYDPPTIQPAIALLAGHLANVHWVDPVVRDHGLALLHVGQKLVEMETWEERIAALEELTDLIYDAHGHQEGQEAKRVLVSFAYHMYGSDSGTLSFQASDDEGESWETIWSESGSQGTSWHTVDLDMTELYSPGTELMFRFHYLTDGGSSYRGDAAVDAIRITDNDDVDDFFSFENNLEGWVHGDGDYNWRRNSGGTSSSSTGPGSAYDGSYYLYCETSDSGANDTFIIENPNLYKLQEDIEEELYHEGLDSLTASIALG